MFDAETVTFLESGSALIVGVAAGDGEPIATRGWGLDVIEPRRAPVTVRVLVDRDDRAADLLTPGARVAVTCVCIRSLRSLQLKGRVLGRDPATAPDHDRMQRYCADFFGDVNATDGTAIALLERLTPVEFDTVVVEVDETFDQTPGPGAGAQVPPA